MDRRQCLIVIPVLLFSTICGVSNNLNGKPGEGYYIQVLIGQPPQSLNVLVDTGSTNFAVAAASAPSINSYFNTSLSSTYQSLMREVSVVYIQGSWKGELGNDIVQFPSLEAHPLRCDLCAIKTSHDFFLNGSQWQGILGLAYPAIARPDTQVLSWLESINKANYSNIGFVINLCGPKQDKNEHEGIFQLLDTDVNSTFTSPIIREWFYELLLTGIEVGNETLKRPCRELNTQKTIIDSGTTNLRLPTSVCSSVLGLIMAQVPLNLSDVFWKHQRPVCTKKELDFNLFPEIKLSLLQTNFSYFKLELPPESYVRRVYDVDLMEGKKYCYKLAIESSTENMGTVLGAVVMEGFIISFSRKYRTVGFSTSHCGPAVKLSGPFSTDQSFWSCRYEAPSSSNGLVIAGYVLSGFLCVMAGVLLYCTYGSFRKNPQRGSTTNSLAQFSQQGK